MKKLVFAFAAIVAVSFASCGNKAAEATENDTIDSIEVVDSSVCDSAVCDSAVADTL